MALVTLKEESRRLGGFYVPQFEVKIHGVGLPRDVLRDVTEITYSDNVTEIDSFEMSVNNWDPTTNDFKYVGSETAADLEGKSERALRYKLFEPCSQAVDVLMGYLGELVPMITGQVTTMEPNFPTGGAPTLTVRGLNALHKLRRKQYTYAWENMKDSEIAESINNLRDPDSGEKRLPLPIKIEPNALNTEEAISYVAQQNLFDVDFLLIRARRRGYVFHLRKDADGNEELYFGPSESKREPVTYHLKWGQSLIEFKPSLTTANQVASVTVNGWDRRTKKTISVTVGLEDLRSGRNQDLYRLLDDAGCGEAREEIVVDEPVFTENEARRRAEAILSDQTKAIVKASGSTIGLPELRAGRKVAIDGLGARFSGTYFVTETTHSINASGYVTRFQARREDVGGGAPA